MSKVENTPAAAAEPAKSPTSPHGVRRIVRRMLHTPSSLFALISVTLIFLLAILGPLIAPYGADERDTSAIFAGPSGRHLLGTDDIGRDTLSRLIIATRTSVEVSVAVVALAVIVALPLGLLSGYKSGKLDTLVMRIADAGLSFPPLILALAIAGVLGPGIGNTVLALSIVFIPSLMRLVRGQALAIREETFIEASQAIGTPDRTILRKRVLPSVLSPLIVQAAIMMGSALLAEAGLSYLGLGAQPPTPSWGNILRRAYDTALFVHPWQVVMPGIAIAVAVLSFNLLGDSLRDALGTGVVKANSRKQRMGITSVRRPKVMRVVERAPAAQSASELLRIEGLTVEFRTEAGRVRVIEDLDLSIQRGETLGLVGESGSGKSVTSMAIMRLLRSPPAEIVGGSVWLNGVDLLSLSGRGMQRVRGDQVAMIFQDPMTSLNPAYTVGNQLIEAQRLHRDVSRADARKRAIELLDLVGIPAAKDRIGSYAHQLSGGMRQRVMIAIALACDPDLLIADEPTTALDVTVQAQILNLLRDLQAEFNMGMLFVTHDLGVIADIADRVAVMYAGQIVEEAPVHQLFSRPSHPYAEGLLGATPRVGGNGSRLTIIPGTVPMASSWQEGCRFRQRCPHAIDDCAVGRLEFTLSKTGARVKCIRESELELVGTARGVSAAPPVDAPLAAVTEPRR